MTVRAEAVDERGSKKAGAAGDDDAHADDRTPLDTGRGSVVLTNWLVNTRTRKRRRRGDSQAAVFSAATQEFAERGYDAARVDRIATRARVNKAMLYYHYGSKQDLYVAVLREMLSAVSARIRGIVEGPGSPQAKLDAWIEAFVVEAAARPWFPPIFLRELASGAAHIDDETFVAMNALFVGVRDVILEGQRDGVFRDADPLLTYMTMVPAILMFFARQRVVSQRRSVQGLAAAAPRQTAEFVRHMQLAVRAMLRKDS
jgi:AcrR family transcriptional regulator